MRKTDVFTILNRVLFMPIIPIANRKLTEFTCVSLDKNRYPVFTKRFCNVHKTDDEINFRTYLSISLNARYAMPAALSEEKRGSAKKEFLSERTFFILLFDMTPPT